MSGLKYWRPVLYLRSMVFFGLFACYTVGFAIPICLSAVLPIRWRYGIARGYPIVTLFTLRVICGLHYRVEGRENLPDTPSIVFSKHQSTWETLALTVQLPAATYVAKRELLWLPFFGWGMAALRFITIDRSSGRRAVEKIVEQARDRFASKLWIIIFPEGTRRPVGAAPNYKIGGAVTAVKTGVPVVPVALNSGEFWPRLSLIKWPGEITMAFGPAIDTTDRTPEEVRELASTWIEGKMQEITRVDRFPY